MQQCSIIGIKFYRRAGVIQVLCHCGRNHFFSLASEAVSKEPKK